MNKSIAKSLKIIIHFIRYAFIGIVMKEKRLTMVEKKERERERVSGHHCFLSPAGYTCVHQGHNVQGLSFSFLSFTEYSAMQCEVFEIYTFPLRRFQLIKRNNKW